LGLQLSKEYSNSILSRKDTALQEQRFQPVQGWKEPRLFTWTGTSRNFLTDGHFQPGATAPSWRVLPLPPPWFTPTSTLGLRRALFSTVHGDAPSRQTTRLSTVGLHGAPFSSPAAFTGFPLPRALNGAPTILGTPLHTA